MLIGAFAGFVLWSILFVICILLLSVSKQRIHSYIGVALFAVITLLSSVVAGATYGAVIELIVWIFS